MDAVTAGWGLGLALGLLPATFAAAYYFVLTFLGWAAPRAAPAGEPTLRLAVLIPAHDEGLTVADAVRSAAASDYPAHLLSVVVVVADNCSDATAAVARGLGATALERADPARRGKGFALAFGLRHVLATPADAVVVLDADCELGPPALRRLAACLAAGAAAAQAAVATRDPRATPAGLVAGVGGQLENAVAAGLDRLGLPAGLRGTGMAFRREVLEAHPWDAYSLAEDAEYAGRLRAAGVAVRFVAGAEVSSEAPPTDAAFGAQRRRWRAALFAPGRGPAYRLLGSKPLVLAQLGLTLAGAGAALPWAPPGAALVAAAWCAGLAALTAAPYLYAARRGGHAAGGHAGLARAARLAARLAVATLAGPGRRDPAWHPSLRVARPPAGPRA